MEKKSRRTLVFKIFLIALFMLSVALTGIVIFSPYGDTPGVRYKAVNHSVEINAPLDSVYSFLGNSVNASRWSVFVDHITTLNADSFPDGSAGCIRRCFCNADESGMRWEELITEVVPGQKRQLTIFNLQEFPLKAEHLATEQLYEPLANNQCRLTFTVFFKDHEPTWIETLKMHFAAYTIKSIFKKNMANIKQITETGLK